MKSLILFAKKIDLQCDKLKNICQLRVEKSNERLEEIAPIC